MAYFLILAAVLLRLVPHLPNFAPITAMAIFGGTYLNKKTAVLVPLGAMLISDYFIGFYNPAVMVSVYLSFMISGILGLWLRRRKNVSNTIYAALLASIQFYALTNFAVWAFGTMYPPTPTGLLTSYINALPFFRNTLLGDLFYVGILFGSYELVRYYLNVRAVSRKHV